MVWTRGSLSGNSVSTSSRTGSLSQKKCAPWSMLRFSMRAWLLVCGHGSPMVWGLSSGSAS